MGKRILIIGGVAGGASAAARARRLSEDAEIIMVERGPYVSFANCGLPYYVGGEITSREKLLVQTPEGLKNRFNIDVRVQTEALSIDRAKRTVELRDLATRRTYSETYDALVLSPGAKPVVPPVPGIERAGLYTVRNVPDVDAITEWIDRVSAQRAVVIGGGYIGLEMVEQLKRKGLEVAVAEAMHQVMMPLDREMAAMLHAELRANGVKLYLGDAVASLESPRGDEQATASVVVLKSGVRLPADVVILGVGVRPENELAAEAGLKIGARGGICVDQQMRTEDPNIWAVGDAVEVFEPVTGAWVQIPLAGPANRQGRIAADSIFGRGSIYSGTWGTAALRLFSLTAAMSGANERSLGAAGVKHQAVHLHPMSHAGYYPGASPIALKLIFSPEGRILGVQAVGKDTVERRVDVIAAAMQSGMTVQQLAEVELCYSPPVGSAKDPVNMAGMVATNVLNGDVDLAQWYEIPKLDPEKTLILDVRNKSERDAGFIPNSIHIPLHDLRGKLAELPRDKDIVAYCQSGQRSYYASRLLRMNGFKVRNLSGSYKTWSTAQDKA